MKYKCIYILLFLPLLSLSEINVPTFDQNKFNVALMKELLKIKAGEYKADTLAINVSEYHSLWMALGDTVRHDEDFKITESLNDRMRYFFPSQDTVFKYLAFRTEVCCAVNYKWDGSYRNLVKKIIDCYKKSKAHWDWLTWTGQGSVIGGAVVFKNGKAYNTIVEVRTNHYDYHIECHNKLKKGNWKDGVFLNNYRLMMEEYDRRKSSFKEAE